MHKTNSLFNTFSTPPLSKLAQGAVLEGFGRFLETKRIVILNFTKRTAAAKRGRVSLYAELFQDLSSVGSSPIFLQKSINMRFRNQFGMTDYTMLRIVNLNVLSLLPKY